MGEREDQEKLIYCLNKLLVLVNGVTAPHRHGGIISKRRLDSLSNYQIEAEKILKEIKKQQ